MSLFDRLGQRPAAPQTQQASMAQLYQAFMANPGQALQQQGLKIPPEIQGNPQAIVNHLIQSGQVGGPVLRTILPMMQKLIRR